MKKETYYFSHDYNTRNDFKIKKMIMKLGYTAYGVYWALIEDLYNNDNNINIWNCCLYSTNSDDSNSDLSILSNFVLNENTILNTIRRG